MDEPKKTRHTKQPTTPNQNQDQNQINLDVFIEEIFDESWEELTWTMSIYGESWNEPRVVTVEGFNLHSQPIEAFTKYLELIIMPHNWPSSCLSEKNAYYSHLLSCNIKYRCYEWSRGVEVDGA